MRAKLRIILCLIAFCVGVGTEHHGSAGDMSIFIVGNAGDVVTSTDGLMVLHGSGTDIDDVFVRMGAAAGGRGFRVETEINALAGRRAPMGGTSVGTAVLGEFVYAAMSARRPRLHLSW